MQEISKAIKEGALAFLGAEYRLLLIFVIIASGALFGISIKTSKVFVSLLLIFILK
jgi:K(+)-stimulated pyrophosphate-energized sodium pump